MSEELPRYTTENLETWAGSLREVLAHWKGELDDPLAPPGDDKPYLEALDGAARLLEDTAATLRSQAKLRRERAAQNIIKSRKAGPRRHRRR